MKLLFRELKKNGLKTESPVFTTACNFLGYSLVPWGPVVVGRDTGCLSAERAAGIRTLFAELGRLAAYFGTSAGRIQRGLLRGPRRPGRVRRAHSKRVPVRPVATAARADAIPAEIARPWPSDQLAAGETRRKSAILCMEDGRARRRRIECRHVRRVCVCACVCVFVCVNVCVCLRACAGEPTCTGWALCLASIWTHHERRLGWRGESMRRGKSLLQLDSEQIGKGRGRGRGRGRCVLGECTNEAHTRKDRGANCCRRLGLRIMQITR